MESSNENFVTDELIDFQVGLEQNNNDNKISEILANDFLIQQQQEMINEQLFHEFLDNDSEILNEKFNVLVNILPDANPDILKKFLETNTDQESLQNFVESYLLNKDYEKRTDYYSRMNNEMKIKEYTTDFDVKRFIKEFPNPFEFFENSERECKIQDQAYQFLKYRYLYDKNIIMDYYTKYKYNISLTDKYLKSAGFVSQIDTYIVEDIPLLQEVTFIRNKDIIKNYLNEMKIKEEQELKQLREQKLLFVCKCCYDEDVKPNDCVECEKNHLFCRNCIIKATNLAISNGKIEVPCLEDCKSEIPISILRKILPQKTFDIFFKKRQEQEIIDAKIDNLFNCPFCTFSMVLDPSILIFSCKNPECMKITCRSCKRENHLPLKCSDVLDEHKGRLFVEEEMTKEIIRYCNNCNLPFVKLDGCNKMTCSKCKAQMCYICKKPIINGYNHFEHGNCKLHNSFVYDEEQRELRRIKATSKLLHDFPDLKLPQI